MTESRSKGGRPSKPDAEKQSLTVRFRVTSRQMEILQRQAKENGCTLSEYARGMTLNGRVIAPISPQRLALVAELTREKNNLNQIAKAQNAAGASAKADELNRIIGFYHTVIQKIKDHDR